ncbi:MAG: NAD(P)H-dependent oxidoreductase [Chitinophagaceae bacterium]|nr:NAD(P)H-dependent oxidoreductase [Chitinophagaceae bacterium]
MDKLFNVLAICGSTKKTSSNLNLIKAIAQLASPDAVVNIYSTIDLIPPFNPDNDLEPALPQVANFRTQIRNADAVLICTPEYAMGVPGMLKNAIDWTVSSAEFYHKPTALITASSIGKKGHSALMETLKVIQCRISPETELIVPFIQTKVNASQQIVDADTITAVQSLLSALYLLVREKQQEVSAL